MTFATLVRQVVLASIVLITLGVGLKARWSDATWFLHHPGELFRAFLAMNIVMLLFAIALARGFALPHAVELALIVLALSPIPPFLPGKQLKAGGEESYVIGLLAGMSLISIVFTPLLATLAGRVFGLNEHIAPSIIAQKLVITIFGPLMLGIVVRAWKPTLADRLTKFASALGNVLLLVGIVCILFAIWHPLVSIIGTGTTTPLAITAFAGVGLLVGHLLGGPNPDHRTSLALATASRHPAVALAIAHATFPGEKGAPAAILLYLIVCTIVSIPYMKWRAHHPGSHQARGSKWNPRPA